MSFNFSSRARRACGALLTATVLGVLPHAARAGEAPVFKLMVRTEAFVPQVLAPGTSTSSLTATRTARARLQGELQTVVPGSYVGRTFSQVGWSVIAIPANSKATALQKLEKAFGAGNVESIHPRYAERAPNDPLYGSQYWLPRINAPSAWDRTTGSRDVIVAVMDSGAGLSHPDLADNLYKNPDGTFGFNALAPGKPPEDDDSSFHGTHVAGIIGARGNNGIQVSGVNWNVRIVPVKVLGPMGGDETTIVAGIDYILGLKAKGVNVRATSSSFGGYGTDSFSQAENDAFKKLDQAGVLNFCSAGNAGTDNDTRVHYPSGYPFNSIVTVGASDKDDAPASFSNRGLKTVSIHAPGVEVLSLGGNGTTQYLSGTSMATPVVTGAAALIWSVRPDLSALAMKELLLRSSFKAPQLRGLSVSGGRLDIGRAIDLLGPLTRRATPTPTSKPEPSFTLSGTVTFNDNGTDKALAGATVTLSNGLKTTTNVNGGYVITGIKAGDYKINGSQTGYTFTQKSVKFVGTAGGSSPVDLQATAVGSARYSISGIVRNSQGRNMVGVPVLLNGEAVPVAVSGDGGRFTIPNLGEGTYTLSASVSRQMAVASVRLPTLTGTSATGVILQPKGTPDRPSAPTA